MANHAYWSRHIRETDRTAGFVLVEPQFHPLMLIENANMAATIAAERQLAPLFLLANPLRRALQTLLRSYPRSRFAYIFDFRADFFRLIRAFLAARRVYTTLKTPDAILSLAIDGIRYGDIVYDTVLQQGYATVDRVDGRTLRELWRFFYYRSKILDLMSRYSIVAAAFTGRHTVTAGTLSRYVLQRGIELVHRSGPRVFAAAKYRTLDEAKRSEYRPDDRYVRELIRSADEVIPRAEAYLQSRLANEIDLLSSPLAFDERKRFFSSRSEFCAHYSVDETRPLVFVMLHVFNDNPHMQEPVLFRDYYQWFERTLEVARQDDSVTWVFKEHPHAPFSPTKDFDFGEVARRYGSRSVLFLDAAADFNPRSLPNLAHAIVTCLGTAGLEYSALGIPCLLGGYGPYSGYGFTIEPKTAEEYLEALRCIRRVPRLTAEQVKMAKLIAYFYLHIVGQPTDPFFRTYADYAEIVNMSFDTMWRDATDNLRHVDPATFDAHLNEVRDFLRRPEYTQYVDFKRFPYLKGALHAS